MPRLRARSLLAVVAAFLCMASVHQTPVARTRTVNHAALRLSKLFGNGMVFQRGKPIAVWGWADPGTRIDVAFHNHATTAQTDGQGRWSARLPAVPAGGPFELTVRGGGESIRLTDVLVGDVWVASGQSNMEFAVKQARDAKNEIALANDSLIREFKVPNSWSNAPESDLAGGGWSPADSKHVGEFSAVAYFFARDLRKSTGVPIAIVNTTWSGSNIETWISRPAQHITDRDWTALLAREDAAMDSMRAVIRGRVGGLPATDAGLTNGVAAWASPSLDDRVWSDIRVPAYWEDEGYPGMDGVAWYRSTFSISKSELQSGATLSMAAIDDDDITWVNGVEVGRTTGYNLERSYRLPASALRAGDNVLAVRVTDGGGGGGINGPVTLIFGDGTKRSLAGMWKFKVGEVSFKPDAQAINKVPSVLYDKMVHPLTPFEIAGIIWYQGESNANNMEQAAAYRGQFKTLIESWRREWRGDVRGKEIPFLWVQLPGYNPPDSVPKLHSTWAAQRESMEAALALPRTGRAVAIDLGEADNIHPKDKQDVGARLALVARGVAYRERVVSSGPTYRSYTMRGDTMVVRLAHVDGKLLIGRPGKPTGAVMGFAVAGTDRKFVWASAKIVGDRIYVWSDDIAHPVALRYAWADNPDRANVYSSASLPLAPFRTDRW